jgi:hypothetical protein
MMRRVVYEYCDVVRQEVVDGTFVKFSVDPTFASPRAEHFKRCFAPAVSPSVDLEFCGRVEVDLQTFFRCEFWHDR